MKARTHARTGSAPSVDRGGEQRERCDPGARKRAHSWPPGGGWPTPRAPSGGPAAARRAGASVWNGCGYEGAPQTGRFMDLLRGAGGVLPRAFAWQSGVFTRTGGRVLRLASVLLRSGRLGAGLAAQAVHRLSLVCLVPVPYRPPSLRAGSLPRLRANSRCPRCTRSCPEGET